MRKKLDSYCKMAYCFGLKVLSQSGNIVCACVTVGNYSNAVTVHLKARQAFQNTLSPAVNSFSYSFN